ARALLEGRRLPEDDEAMVVVEGILQADAAPTMTGVSLAIAVDAVATAGSMTKISGVNGVLLTVVGALSAEHFGEWRRGRRVRLPAPLHRPARYLDPYVPDAERALARRGITLVGSVKSGALVEVVARGTRVDELAAAVRAYARRAIAQSVGRWNPRSAA